MLVIAKKLLLFTALLTIFIAGAAPVTANVLAASSEDSSKTTISDETADDLVEYCQQAIDTRKAEAGCTTKEVQRAYNTASYEQTCVDEPTADSRRVDCIIKAAKGYINDAAKSNPKNSSDFVNKLEAILKGTKGRPEKFNENADGSVAATTSDGSDQSNCAATDGSCATCESKNAADCDVGCSDGLCNDPAADPNVDCKKYNCDFVQKYINPIINLFSITFGLLAVMSIILGGIQYSTSEGDPQKVSSAKTRIINTLIAVVAYFFLYAFLQFIVPGGLFRK